ncbi:phosphoadenylyl-sulfate reductase [Aneurinibacillus aneurinilyticus]|uniref:Adenosine 5'-phosphosulfate reductase n=2 Tax=Aneurinibacillus aneurinilyticus TaxID=1391 RepID=A0A848CYU2_ANEAE|nr:phosphoadenylyl-sulfate reductase [Aneurinibacillus aneurinilyticus]ERI11781.1 phosophoadenylyl-sulfate reductase [Aneurinibacillus aneurinilyticus ATCC 12856]MED0673606.1 phosphoadenylyl-sulfate reductase [Aneurinibacillus aneurinilyticus]MED0706598.1 phosphoadenylyl-sulfate reductase [Aneurinibacillus aneurinilyticus]MED0725585.1 phosphoadenylyl-sulfate reductase [Aneurinibacillus aneurinilyticus]MED0734774.1 phosphoadenylyl-sulfate reductase [Aneurinibacillus aneurinilyticus]
MSHCSNLSFHQLTDDAYQEMNKELSYKDTIDVVKWAYHTFADELVYACSFGAEGIVLIDMISKIRPNAHIVFLDTNVHFKETYELVEKVQQAYPSLRIEIIQPALTLAQQAEQHGGVLWRTEPNTCCSIRKLQPLAKVLANKKAWLSGLRREQSSARAHVQFINKDQKFASIKICPLIHWTWDDVWNYINLYQLPYNELHDKGYPSIGCEHCTLPVEVGENFRAGRWAGFEKTECGLHQ